MKELRSILGDEHMEICYVPVSSLGGSQGPRRMDGAGEERGSDTKFDAGEWPALVGLTDL